MRVPFEPTTNWVRYAPGIEKSHNNAPKVTLTVLVPANDLGSTEGMRSFLDVYVGRCRAERGGESTVQSHRTQLINEGQRSFCFDLTSASSWLMVWARWPALPLALPIWLGVLMVG